MCVTIGNQFEILMLIESLEENEIHVLSANTDGITSLFNKDKHELYYQICKDWEKVVGNDDMGQLEYVQYKKLIQSSVNDYIAIKTDDKMKCKGDFVSDFEIHKNKSARIIPLALQNYFSKGIKVEQTILNHIKCSQMEFLQTQVYHKCKPKQHFLLKFSYQVNGCTFLKFLSLFFATSKQERHQ